MANCLGIPQSDIRLISQYSVGGYGAKRPEKTATLTAIMARRTGRPVKASFSRTEDFIGTHRRISFRNYNKVGVRKDGTITAIYSKLLANWGNDSHVPYISQGSALSHACNMLYRWQNSKGETCGVLTNINAYGAMNGFGDPEGVYSIERLMDEAAEKIDMDPVAFRYMNCMRYGDKAIEMLQVLHGPIEWGVLGPDLDSFPELIELCAEKAKWKEKWKGWRMPVAMDGYRNTGIGIAIGMHHTAVRPSSAIVKMNQDGSANVLSGAVEIGQGLATAISQVVAEVLGIRYGEVNPVLADTWATPASMGVFASGGTSSEVNAAKLAAEDVKRKLCELAAPGLQASPDDLELKDSKIYVRGTEKSVPIAEVCLHNFQITGTANNLPYHVYRDDKTGKVIHPYAAAVTIAEIDVDMETGKIYVNRIISGHDCGRAINPTIVENQIDLGLTMANGWVRSEEYVIDPKTGIMVNPNLLDYKLMTFLDMPERDNLQKIVLEKPCAWGPFGAKGFSETAMTALGPAIANAVYNATGVRIYCASLTPENLLRELEKREKGEPNDQYIK
jgi:xanthine dehydrogenase molybdenum-binding subunit